MNRLEEIYRAVLFASLTGGSFLAAEPAGPAGMVPSGPLPAVIAAITTSQSSPIVDDSGERVRDAATVRALLTGKKFDELESLLQRWTDTQARNSSGSWRVEVLSSGSRPEVAGKDDPAWEAFQHLHEAWRAQAKTPSPWQVVAEATFWIEYGWEARGTGYADTVTPQGWRLLAARLDRGEELMTRHWDLVRGLPSAHVVMSRLAVARGYPRARRDELMANAIALWPDYNAFYFGYAIYVLPRWYGRPGELKEWAWRATEGRPEDFRREIYARIAWSLVSSHRLVMKETGMEWPGIRAGFEVLRAKWPASGHILNRYARFAWQANDRSKARELLLLIGDRPVKAAWGTPENFAKFRQWANPTGQGGRAMNARN